MNPTSAVVCVLLVLGACGDDQASPRASDPADEATGTVSGIVTLGPQCPVESAENPCPTIPPADVAVTVAERLPGEAYAAGAPVATGTTDANGAFTLEVPPGEYVVTAEAGMSCEIMDLVVVADTVVDVLVPCDTGIR